MGTRFTAERAARLYRRVPRSSRPVHQVARAPTRITTTRGNTAILVPARAAQEPLRLPLVAPAAPPRSPSKWRGPCALEPPSSWARSSPMQRRHARLLCSSSSPTVLRLLRFGLSRGTPRRGAIVMSARDLSEPDPEDIA